MGLAVPAQTFIEKISELKPDIMGVSCYLTTTMVELKAMVTLLKDNGLRDKVKIMIGGVPTTQACADEIGADAWDKGALDVVDKARQLMGA